MNSTAAFTVANEHFAANARVLFEDLARFQAKWDRVVVTSEDFDLGLNQLSSGVVSYTARELGMTEAVAFSIGMPESFALAAMVPWGFESLFARGYRRVIFFSPFVRCYGQLKEFSQSLASNDAVLIPRILQPFSDSLTSGAKELRIAGHFDSALIGFKNTNETRSLVRRWMEMWRDQWLRAEPGTTSDPSAMLLDLLPAILDRIAVLRNPGYQVSLWNLQDREVVRDSHAGKWKLRAGPHLRTMNFDGFIGDAAIGSRFHREAWPAWLCQLVADYAEKLQAAAPRPVRRGVRSDLLTRILPMPAEWQQEALASAEVKGALLTAETKKAAAMILRDFAELPDSEMPNLPWLLAEACRKIPELNCCMNELPAEKLKGRIEDWLAGEGAKVCRVRPRTLLRPVRHNTARMPSVNVFGCFTLQNGIAEAARSTARALAPPVSVCHNVNYIGGLPSPYANPGVVLSLPHADPAFEIVHVNCDGVPLFYGEHAEIWDRSSYKIGYWLWELETLPAQALDHARLFNEIWCASEFNRRCFEQLGDISVRLAPLMVNPNLASIAQAGGRRMFESGLSDRQHWFLTMADFLSCPERKNPLAAIEAYIAAFPRDNGETGLLVKASNTGIRPDYLEALRQAADGRRDVRFLLENLDAGATARLVANSAALVSLHTTEGFGLPIAEALALGRPVIATGYGGNVDFCQGPIAHLISYTMATLEKAIGPYERGTRWASPNLEEAACAYRAIYEQRRHARNRFRPQVEEFNRLAQRQYYAALDCAVKCAATNPGVRFSARRLKVAIFGAGSGGERLGKQLLRRHDVVCFIDNDPNKIGKTLLGLPIISPKQIDALTVDRILIGSMHRTQICNQLLSLGVPQEKMSFHSLGF
jgi:glycosyltransferase involved in cell wall biosynthesis